MKYNKTIKIIAIVISLVGCSGRDSNEPKSMQVIAKVNDNEITIHQLNMELASRNLPSNIDNATLREKVLDDLVSQTLLVEKAYELKLDRKPKVMQAIERAKTQVLAEAYLQHFLAAPEKPSDQEIKKFYDSHPELFSQRKVYQIEELLFDNSLESSQLQEQLSKAKNFEEIINWVKKNKIKAKGKSITRSAEKISTPILLKIKDKKVQSGDLIEGPNGKLLIWVSNSVDQPISLETAKQQIAQHLIVQKRKEAVKAEVERLRAMANVQYVGQIKSGDSNVDNTSNDATGDKIENAAGDEKYIDKGILGLK